MRIPLLFLLVFVAGASWSQQCERVLFTGRVVDTLRPQNFYNLMIIDRSTGRGVFGQPNGTFSVYVSDGDTVTVSVKEYKPINIVVNADSNCQFRKKLYIEGKPQEIQEVTVTPLKTLEQIKEEREALAMRETRMVTGIEVMQSPITALYQAFSKVERNKRWIAEQEYRDNQRKVVKELLRVYVAYDIIELTEEDFDAFIDFLNISEDFLKTATEMELITFIHDKFEHFKIINKLKNDADDSWRKSLNTNKKAALTELLNMYVSNKVIELPTSEYERFIAFMDLEENFLMNETDAMILDHVQRKHKAYLDFYKIDVRLLNSNFNITEEDNEDWKWELKRNKDKEAAIRKLLDLYNQKKVIQLSIDEYDKFMIFLNLKESFMNSASSDQLIQFVRKKYYDYLDFYRKQ